MQQSFVTKASREEEAVKALYTYKGSLNNTNYNVVMEPDQYSAYDCVVCKQETNCITVEVKVRDKYSYKQIQSLGGLFLELKKLEGILIKQAIVGSTTPINYVNIYSDCAVIYNISSNISDHIWELENLQQNDYSKEPIYKFVTKLPESSIVEIISRKNQIV